MRSIIPALIVQCLIGDTIRLGNLHPTRDLNFVSNTVEGFPLAAFQPSALRQSVDHSSGHAISVGDLATLIEHMIDKQIRIENENQCLHPHGSEVERLLAQNALAQKLLDWKPKASLEEDLTRTISWKKDNLGLYRDNAYVY